MRSVSSSFRGFASLAAGALLAASTAGAADLLARVDPRWSAFQRGEAPAETEELVAQARDLMGEDPARVARVLSGRGEADAESGLLLGLRADALYFEGSLLEAQRLYSALERSTGLPPEQTSWTRFMMGNIHKGLGFPEEARAAYRASSGTRAGPWSPALEFDLGVLELEQRGYAEARDRFAAWLQIYGDEPGRPLILYLLAECEYRLGEEEGALARYESARRLDPSAWIVRPETGYALAELLRRRERTLEAVDLLERLGEVRPGTPEAARALLSVGEAWEEQGAVARAARAYARLLDTGTPPREAQEARLRLALLGVENAEKVELTEPLPAYRVFYRPGPTLREFATGRDPVAAQRALGALALLSRDRDEIWQALQLLARSFQEYPESPESGRAYGIFMDLLESHLAAQLAAGEYERVVSLYEALKPASGWAPTRDTGLIALRAAEAYEALGAPALARSVYRQTLDAGTRALDAEELRVRILRTRAAEGDPDAIREWASRRPNDWRAQLLLARSLGDREASERRRAYDEAARLAPAPVPLLYVLAERDRWVQSGSPAAARLAALETRADLWSALPRGAEHREIDREGRLVEARLRFAMGEYSQAARLYGELDQLDAPDRYLRALAERRAGNDTGATGILGSLTKDGDVVFSGLAKLHLEIGELLARPELP